MCSMRRQPLYFYNDTRTAVVASRSPVNIKQTDRGCFTALRRFVLRSHGNRSPRKPRKCYHDMSFLTKAYLTANIQCHLSRRQSRMWRVFLFLCLVIECGFLCYPSAQAFSYMVAMVECFSQNDLKWSNILCVCGLWPICFSRLFY